MIREPRRSSHKAVALLSRGRRHGLFLLNAGSFLKPIGPPTVQVSSIESQWLKEQAQQRAEATLVAHVSRTAAQAFNVAAKIAGSNPALAPLVLIAPRDSCWACRSVQPSPRGLWRH